MTRFHVLSDETQLQTWLPEILEVTKAERQQEDSHLYVQEPAFYGHFHGEHGRTIVVEIDGRLAGFTLLGFEPAINAYLDPDIERLGLDRAQCSVGLQSYVAPQFRGRGLGRGLMDVRCQSAAKAGKAHILLTTHPANTVTLRLLKSLGAQEIDRREVYTKKLPRVILHKEVSPALAEDRPRVQLCASPSPLQPLKRLSAALGGPEIWIKRDDQIGIGLGGNKSRMLEYIAGEALEHGARTLVTRGSVYSNHCRQTAAVAARLGLGCELVLKGDPPAATNGNHLLDLLFGANITWTRGHEPDDVLMEAVEIVQRRGDKPYLIQYGGANPVGASSYVDAVLELMDQGGWFHRIYVASSSGATQSGLVAGCAHLGLHTQVMGISVDDDRQVLTGKVHALSTTIIKHLNLKGSHTLSERINVTDDYLGGGYAVVGEPEREAISLFAQTEGILLDPIYTARAAAGMIDQIRRGNHHPNERLLFWHTGGVPSLFAMPNQVLSQNRVSSSL